MSTLSSSRRRPALRSASPSRQGGERGDRRATQDHALRDDDALHLYVDGGARGNPGPAGIGGRLLDPDGEVVEEFSDAIGKATNNVAEYEALITGLELALERGVARADRVHPTASWWSSSSRGEYKVKDANLRPARRGGPQPARLPGDHVKNVRREQNTEADRLVNEALDAPPGTDARPLPLVCPPRAVV